MKKVLGVIIFTLMCFALNTGYVDAGSKAEKPKEEKTDPTGEYVIDTEKAHAFIQFKISHLGYSWLYGRFNTFSGEFTYNHKKPGKSKIKVDIDPASVDTNFALRDKHIREEGLFEVDKFPKSSFVSTSYEKTGDTTGVLKGDFTFHGVTKNISIDVTEIGYGKDPWGGYRMGFEGVTNISMKEFGITKNLGPASDNVEIHLSIEGIRK